MRERELLDALLSAPGSVLLTCRENVVYCGSEAIGQLREGQLFEPASQLATSQETDLLRNLVTWQLQKDRTLRRLVRPPAGERAAF